MAASKARRQRRMALTVEYALKQKLLQEYVTAYGEGNKLAIIYNDIYNQEGPNAAVRAINQLPWAAQFNEAFKVRMEKYSHHEAFWHALNDTLCLPWLKKIGAIKKHR